jgi:hypothetical protein
MIEAAWRGHKDREVVFLGINIQDKEDAARKFLEEFDVVQPGRERDLHEPRGHLNHLPRRHA